MYDQRTNFKPKKILLSSNYFSFIVLSNKCFSLCANQMDHTTAYHIMAKTFLDLELTSKEMKTSKRVQISIRRVSWNLNHLNILYYTRDERLQVTIKWKANSCQSPQRIQVIASNATITFLLNRFYLEGGMSKRSCQEKTATLENEKKYRNV